MSFHQLLLIGFLLIFIDIQIDTFDVFPDPLGFLLIISAFLSVKEKYSKIGLIAAIISFIMSIVLYFEPQFAYFIVGEYFYSYDLNVELYKIISSSAMIILYGSVFAVSNEMIPLKSKFLPRVLIGSLIVYEFAAVFWVLRSDIVEGMIFIPITIVSFLAHIAFFLFLNERSSQLKQVDSPITEAVE